MLLLGSKLTTKYPLSLQRMQLLMWVLTASPLLMSNDLTKMSPEVLSMLTNPALLNIHKDPAVTAARRIIQAKDTEVWVRALKDGSAAVGFVNLGPNRLLCL